jgi:hypothetical protein
MVIKKGSIIVYSLIIIVAASIIFVGLIRFVTEHFKLSLHAQPKQEALHIAESGIYYYRWYLGHHVDGKTIDAVLAFWDSDSAYGVDKNRDGVCDETEAYERDFDGTNTIGKYRICVVPPVAGATNAAILSTGWTYKEPNVKRSIRVRMRRPAWSEFVLLSDSELDITEKNSTFYGSVHSNQGVRLDGVAYGPVSSSVASYTYNGDTKDGIWTSWTNEFNTTLNANVFSGAKVFPAPVQDFNSVVVSFEEIAKAAQGQYELPAVAGGQGWHITLLNNGIAKTCWVKKVNNTTKAIESENCDHKKLPDNKNDITLLSTSAIYLRNDLWIDGVLDAGKRLTIAGHHNGVGRNQSIYINGDLTYENYTSWTVLGLATEENVDIVRDPNLGSNNRLDVDAAILAQYGFVGRSDYADSTLANLKLYGAIAAKQGFVQNGVQSSTLTYDPNFMIVSPPYFPTGSSYVIDQWTEME